MTQWPIRTCSAKATSLLPVVWLGRASNSVIDLNAHVFCLSHWWLKENIRLRDFTHNNLYLYVFNALCELCILCILFILLYSTLVHYCCFKVCYKESWIGLDWIIINITRRQVMCLKGNLLFYMSSTSIDFCFGINAYQAKMTCFQPSVSSSSGFKF